MVLKVLNMEESKEKRIIEAALFLSGRELTIEELKRVTGIAAHGYLEKMVGELKQEYERNGSALEIIEDSKRYAMRVKEEYGERVKSFAQDAEISKGGLRVLGFIYKNNRSILKSSIAKRLGAWIYPYVQELIDRGFVDAKKAGRTNKLTLTKKFDTYFTSAEFNKKLNSISQTESSLRKENPLPVEASKEEPPEEVTQKPQEGTKEMEE